jgi:hypothetical protein
MSLASEQFCFLLGAGASKAAGIPLMREMGEEFRKRIAENSPELLSVLDNIPDDPKYGSWRSELNIEALLFYLYASANLETEDQLPPDRLSSGNVFFDVGIASPATKERQQHATKAAILALKAQGFVLDRTSHHTSDLSYLCRLRDLLPRDGPLDIFTLNYDTVLRIGVLVCVCCA